MVEKLILLHLARIPKRCGGGAFSEIFGGSFLVYILYLIHQKFPPAIYKLENGAKMRISTKIYYNKLPNGLKTFLTNFIANLTVYQYIICNLLPYYIWFLNPIPQ